MKFIFFKVSFISTNTDGTTLQMPSNFMFALDVYGVGNSSNPMNFLIGFTSQSEMYVISFPNTVSDNSLIYVSQSSI